MNRLNINILGICETGWANNEDFVSDRHRIIYEVENEREREVLDQYINKSVLRYEKFST